MYRYTTKRNHLYQWQYIITHFQTHIVIKRVKKERDEIREWINLNEIQCSDDIMTLQTTTTTAIITTGICMI